jgi:maltooligosyltrehalose trehalohydrolase
LGLSAHRFVAFLQNHDQVGNRALGERIGNLVTIDQLKIAAALLMSAPFVPMLFQGEEWNASTPFQYFTDLQDSQLAESVRQGRRAEFAHFVANASEIPDPQASQTFQRSKLDWDERESGTHRELYEWYRRLIRLRRCSRDLKNGQVDLDAVKFDEHARWLSITRGDSMVICNFAAHQQRIPIAHGEQLEMALASAPGVRVAAATIDLPAISVAILMPKDRDASTGAVE